ncbi:right-handed parallel beta-helix repeat-containing protein [bacterium]|nr:right-handed parallel beta-helix repeat-containing protein [candidate division CSSED10-310 bacterium]
MTRKVDLRRHGHFIIPILCLMICPGLSALAGTILVPGDAATIQAGIDAAAAGDLILVRPGTYRGAGNRDISLRGKAVTVASEQGSTSCTIDCEGEAPGFRFVTGGSDTELRGLTITGAVADFGAALYCAAGSLVMRECVLRECTAGAGGAVYCGPGATPHFIDCEFSSNTIAADGYGAAVYGEYADLLLEHCVFAANGAAFRGGALYTLASAVTMRHCRLSGNSSSYYGYGGALYCEYSDLELVNCELTDNVGFWGGGLYCLQSRVAMQGLSTRGNQAWSQGGMAMLEETEADIQHCVFSADWSDFNAACFSLGAGTDCSIVNCLFTGNHALSNGACLDLYDAAVALDNCALLDNLAEHGAGGGLRAKWSEVALRNCILWGNETDQIYQEESEVTVTHCDIQDGYDGEGNFSAEPLFTAGPYGTWYLSSQAAGQEQDSPCIDAGDCSAEEVSMVIGEERYTMGELTTRTDEVCDTGVVDVGCHLVPADRFTPTPEPTPTTTPIAYGVRLTMPAVRFIPGDACGLTAELINNTGEQRRIVFAAVLEVTGEYWFWDGWTAAPDGRLMLLAPGVEELPLVDGFIWPETGGEEMHGLRFWAAMLDASTGALLDEATCLACWVFSYST